jgi:hypothetical protein
VSVVEGFPLALVKAGKDGLEFSGTLIDELYACFFSLPCSFGFTFTSSLFFFLALSFLSFSFFSFFSFSALDCCYGCGDFGCFGCGCSIFSGRFTLTSFTAVDYFLLAASLVEFCAGTGSPNSSTGVARVAVRRGSLWLWLKRYQNSALHLHVMCLQPTVNSTIARHL